MMYGEAEKIRVRLAQLEGVKAVTRGWPRHLSALPCIAVTKAADTPVDFRDDRSRLTELEFYVRVFAEQTARAEEIAAAAEAAMEEMGYTRTFACDEDEDEVRIAAMRCRKIV